ncbi:MAG TPA: FISUMP domain-containing protein [Bacteroidales bacterium]|nr:FISUMP domain-containing protein [Bacteroidales bacterium]HSA44354.1 FISUMP domain-containing protein [Bacteroidales bacterium]
MRIIAVWMLLTGACCLEGQAQQADVLISQGLSGRVSYGSDTGILLYDVSVSMRTLSGQLIQTVQTDAMGYYEFDLPLPGTYVITIASSLPAGGYNALAALAALRHFVGQVTLSGLNFSAADVDGSTYVNTNDAMLIVQGFIGQIPAFPAGAWVFESDTLNITTGDSIVLNLQGLCYGDPLGRYIPPGCIPMPDDAYAGPDKITSDTATILQGNDPLAGTGVWNILSGAGGSLSDTTDPHALLTGLVGNTYILTWTIATICYSSTDTVLVSFKPPCGLPFTDVRDGMVYNTVQIGTQCWMQQNLNIGTMVTSVYIPGNIHSECSNNGIIEKYCFFNDTSYCNDFGGLYDWNELMGYVVQPGVQGICPDEWHIPTDAEWCTMLTYIDPAVNCSIEGWSGTDAGSQLKEQGTAHWGAPNTATNASGFTAFGSGIRSQLGLFTSMLSEAFYWTSTKNTTYHALAYFLWPSRPDICRARNTFLCGQSVRCIRNF